MNIVRFSLIYLYLYIYTHTHIHPSYVCVCIYNHVVCLYIIKCFFLSDYTIEYKAYNFSKDFIIEQSFRD